MHGENPKLKNYMFWVCVSVALVIHHVMRMRRFVLSYVAR